MKSIFVGKVFASLAMIARLMEYHINRGRSFQFWDRPQHMLILFFIPNPFFINENAVDYESNDQFILVARL